MESTHKNPKRLPRLRFGDVFAVDLDDGTVKYFQYVADDLSQLNSRVIRVFKRRFQRDQPLDLKELVQGEVDFFSHVFIPVGLKLGVWRKVGYCPQVGTVDIYFRDTNDDLAASVSENWWVWKINQERVYIGKLTPKYHDSEIGLVFNPFSIKERMQTGVYGGVYPKY